MIRLTPVKPSFPHPDVHFHAAVVYTLRRAHGTLGERMDKSCANHPESMALATCKACDKSVCLMCVVDEKEGTFCSTECHAALSSGQEVQKFVAAVTESSASPGVQKIDSIFDDEPAAPAAEGLPLPPSEDAVPIVAEGTKWRSIGAQCENHADTPAVANCDRCGKAVCALCLLEAAQGTFCSADCMSSVVKQPASQPAATAERAALQGKPVFHFKEPPKTFSGGKLAVGAVILVLLAGGAYYGWTTLSPEVVPPQPPTPPVTTTVTPPVTPTTTTTKKPVTTKPDTTKPDTTKPNTVKPETTKTTPPKVKPDTTKPDPTPVVARPKPPPKAVPIRTRTLNPWAAQEQGAWYRIRLARGGTVQYTDIGLKEKGMDYYVLTTQTSTGGQASAVNESKNAVTSVVLRGEESFKFEDQSYLCEIQAAGPEDGDSRTWSLLSGKNAGAVLKLASSQLTMTARRVWEHTLRVKNRSFDCLVVEAQLDSGGTSRTIKSWYCAAVPMGLIQQEREGESMALIDFGDNWSKRPAFPK